MYMSHTGTQPAKERRQERISMMIILPAIALGIFAMIHDGISSALWAQQAAAFALCLFMLLLKRRAARRGTAAVLAAVLVVFLAVSLLGSGAGGARSWVNLGGFSVNAALLVLPALLVLLGGVRRFELLLLCAAAVLSIQPDFSQLTALAAASLPLLWHGRRERGWRIFCVAVLSVLAVVCLRIPVEIESVPYCEGVLSMLGKTSWTLMAAGAVSLIVIPVFWICRYFKENSIWMLSLSVYYMVTILFGLSGAYPVPFMGFGLSPIVGYWLAALFAPDTENRTEE